ncbi:MAG: twin-arginine translocation signal domain-containing protein, partial [Pseudomonadota bacterium]|nr:twin-arginine translocation signal domain-containing protein [Pseudomonadota bacterium]
MSITRRNFLFTAAAAPAVAAVPAPVLASQTSEKRFQGTYRFTVGDATVTALLDGYLDVAPALIPGFDEAGVSAALEKSQQKLYPGGVQGDDFTVVRKMRIGQLHGGALAAGTLIRFYTDLQIYNMPLQFD